MAFKSVPRRGPRPESPEALFRDLRGRTVEGLLSQQADVLRGYMKAGRSARDVALQLPTGSGKTLVGLLLGEWLRRHNDERVVYLCPTRQLVVQVASQAESRYGLHAKPFVGPKADYDPTACSEWQSGESIAVAPYAALFNSKPFFESPHVIICDDAHAAENYIANPWSLLLDAANESTATAFAAVSQIISPSLEAHQRQRLQGETRDAWVDALPLTEFAKYFEAIARVLDPEEAASIRFTWVAIRDNLACCNLYYAPKQILIRPLISPTLTHRPFSDARQRIYMSATLGGGGDLERITGRCPITRIPVPPEYDRHGVGRRLFLLPTQSLSPDNAERFMLSAIRRSGRALILTSSNADASRVQALVESELKYPVFTGPELEQRKEEFTSKKKAVAIAANRYDGIDLPGDDCRLLIVDGISQTTNLQERFFVTRLSARELLGDRIRTRMVQAFGRCTRADTDYACVIILDDHTLRFVLSSELRHRLHPELQAELEFGTEQSKETTAPELLKNLDAFLEQSDEWSEAAEGILALREGCEMEEIPGIADLARSVEHEIAYSRSAWASDHAGAIESARAALTELRDPHLRGYRGLWNYMAGCAAWRWARSGRLDMDSQARSFFHQAADAAPGVSWLRHFAARPDDAPQSESAALPSVIDRLELRLDQLGIRDNHAFDREVSEIESLLASDAASKFEEGLKRLGLLLGYDAGRKSGSAAPDAWWIADRSLAFTIEAHTESKGKGEVGAEKARQAADHPVWLREKVAEAAEARILPILLTPCTQASDDARPLLRNVLVWNPADFRIWSTRALSTVRRLRSAYSGQGNLFWRGEVGAAYDAADVSPLRLAAYLEARPAKTVLAD